MSALTIGRVRSMRLEHLRLTRSSTGGRGSLRPEGGGFLNGLGHAAAGGGLLLLGPQEPAGVPAVEERGHGVPVDGVQGPECAIRVAGRDPDCGEPGDLLVEG